MKWWLIAWREIRWEVFLDRASLLRTGVFVGETLQVFDARIR